MLNLPYQTRLLNPCILALEADTTKDGLQMSRDTILIAIGWSQYKMTLAIMPPSYSSVQCRPNQTGLSWQEPRSKARSLFFFLFHLIVIGLLSHGPWLVFSHIQMGCGFFSYILKATQAIKGSQTQIIYSSNSSGRHELKEYCLVSAKTLLHCKWFLYFICEHFAEPAVTVDVYFIPMIFSLFHRSSPTSAQYKWICIVTTYYSINSTIANVQPWAPFARPAAPVWQS